VGGVKPPEPVRTRHDEWGKRALWLWLKELGKVQARAAQQLLEMSEQEPLRDATVRLLIAWQQSLPPRARERRRAGVEDELGASVRALGAEGQGPGPA
jgi:hypothetical protein